MMMPAPSKNVQPAPQIFSAPSRLRVQSLFQGSARQGNLRWYGFIFPINSPEQKMQ
jgi:hypothetical protein